eukprot:m.464609 g.464609  ORF g.464609 m.464609 type:complete len:269 (-) comp23613_c0_seq1:10-816(-)
MWMWAQAEAIDAPEDMGSLKDAVIAPEFPTTLKICLAALLSTTIMALFVIIFFEEDEAAEREKGRTTTLGTTDASSDEAAAWKQGRTLNDLGKITAKYIQGNIALGPSGFVPKDAQAGGTQSHQLVQLCQQGVVIVDAHFDETCGTRPCTVIVAFVQTQKQALRIKTLCEIKGLTVLVQDSIATKDPPCIPPQIPTAKKIFKMRSRGDIEDARKHGILSDKGVRAYLEAWQIIVAQADPEHTTLLDDVLDVVQDHDYVVVDPTTMNDQ